MDFQGLVMTTQNQGVIQLVLPDSFIITLEEYAALRKHQERRLRAAACDIGDVITIGDRVIERILRDNDARYSELLGRRTQCPK
jgi:hypothetical protein